MDLNALEPGQLLVEREVVITTDRAAAYLDAVGDDSPLYGEEGLVPPMAVAAIVMSEAIEAISMPAGTVHTTQELTFARPVASGAMLRCTAKVASNSVRRGTRFLALDLRGDCDDDVAVEGRTTLAIAEQDE